MTHDELQGQINGYKLLLSQTDYKLSLIHISEPTRP